MSDAQKMVRVQGLRACVQEDFYHASYEKFYSTLRALVQSKLSVEQCIREVMMFLGPARVGKTQVLKGLDLEFGQVRQTDSGRCKDVVYVRVPSGGSAGAILGATLRAMGEPYQAAIKLDEARNRLRQRFLSTGTKVAIFDEIQHTVEEGRKTAIRAASDFIKDLIEDNPQVTFIFSGTPLGARLREENAQLRGRCDKPIYFLPYCWANTDEREQFAAVALAVYNSVCEAMETKKVDAMRFIRACYLLGGGCFGFVINFVRSLANALEQDEHATHLQHHHLALAFDKNSRDEDFVLNPFESDAAITDEMLLQAWTYVMNEHGLKRFVPTAHLVKGAR